MNCHICHSTIRKLLKLPAKRYGGGWMSNRVSFSIIFRQSLRPISCGAFLRSFIMLRRIIAFLGDLSLCSRPHFAALRLLYLTLQATVQVAYLIINIIELQFSPCTFLLPIREIFIPFPGFSRYDVPFTNHFLSSFHCFFVGFPCFPLRKCIAIPLFHYATFCFRMSDLLNTSVSGDSSKTVRLVIIVCT